MANNFSSSSAAAASEVDASIWRAIVGASVQIPPVNTYVYYFPQGHLEHYSSLSPAAVNTLNFPSGRPFIPCQVLSVRFLSDRCSDRAFVKIVLQPLLPFGPRPVDNGDGDGNNQGDVVSFSKVLTPSDANNGGGFSVPRFCADIIFPSLDFAAEPPVQNLTLRDTHGNAWEFRHIYRGTPRRHLLTTGWSKFVNAKRLVAGDSVVFMRKRSTNELFIGVRRAQKSGGMGGGGEAALEAIENAAKGMVFEVVYHPAAGLPDFVVKAEKAKEGMRMCWNVGMRVKMAVETDDSSRMTWFQGTITAASTPVSGPWFGSPWRMLQVNWDEPESVHNSNRVSPWQVEYVPPSPLLNLDFHPSKRLKLVESPDCLSATGLTHLNSGVLLKDPPVPVPHPGGIQGARRDHILIARPSTTNVFNGPRTKEMETVSTILSIGSSYSGNSSQTSVAFAAPGSFQLFGKTIHLSKPSDGTYVQQPCFGRPPDRS